MNLTMYGDEDTPVSILIERKRLDKYVPPKILRTLGDYVRHKAVIEELKSKEVMTIRPFSIVVLELKEKLKTLNSYLGEPIYGGNMYEYRWVYPFNRCIMSYYKGIKNWEWEGSGEFIKRMNLPEFDDVVTKYILLHNEVKDDPEKIKEYIKKYYGTTRFADIRNTKYHTRGTPNIKRIKIRVVIGTMNYNGGSSFYYHPRNLKRWDKVTKKTSNAGLKADTTYSWSNEYGRGGWSFGGITIDTLEHLYRVNNGLKPNATKDATGKKITLKYGDYAEWYLHKLE